MTPAEKKAVVELFRECVRQIPTLDDVQRLLDRIEELESRIQVIEERAQPSTDR